MKDEVEEFWHLASDGEGCAGPFSSVEEAKADAMTIIEEEGGLRFSIPIIKIVKVVAESRTKTTRHTTWKTSADV